ncbi:hypothetical protein AB7250_08375 [Providencia stuartii]|uniref:hypothetical protein n=1 Tax=Providencia TaxID=586 RepID=UPI0018CA37B0|nr:hypothetical protein [Providencia stuartii]MBQ0456179.1 hypothetical protein [Providencia stuartii]QPN42297.1 hypothetical protein I3B46_09435 [Providencia sp. 2.29]WAZ76991.1 hypothetical protein O4001_12045 [Providencia stuartii]WAZ81859.1 hypothetical protein O4002_15975 [Providencia stuartii]
MSKMKDITYQRCIEVIETMRNKDFFMFGDTAISGQLSRTSAHYIILRLLRAGSIECIGQCVYNSRITNCYKVKQNAVELLDKMNAEMELPTSERFKTDNFSGGMKTVKKANVAGMGCVHLKHLDQLLAGVRA